MGDNIPLEPGSEIQPIEESSKKETLGGIFKNIKGKLQEGFEKAVKGVGDFFPPKEEDKEEPIIERNFTPNVTIKEAKEDFDQAVQDIFENVENFGKGIPASISRLSARISQRIEEVRTGGWVGNSTDRPLVTHAPAVPTPPSDFGDDNDPLDLLEKSRLAVPAIPEDILRQNAEDYREAREFEDIIQEGKPFKESLERYLFERGAEGSRILDKSTLEEGYRKLLAMGLDPSKNMDREQQKKCFEWMLDNPLDLVMNEGQPRVQPGDSFEVFERNNPGFFEELVKNTKEEKERNFIIIDEFLNKQNPLLWEKPSANINEGYTHITYKLGVNIEGDKKEILENFYKYVANEEFKNQAKLLESLKEPLNDIEVYLSPMERREFRLFKEYYTENISWTKKDPKSILGRYVHEIYGSKKQPLLSNDKWGYIQSAIPGQRAKVGKTDSQIAEDAFLKYLEIQRQDLKQEEFESKVNELISEKIDLETFTWIKDIRERITNGEKPDQIINENISNLPSVLKFNPYFSPIRELSFLYGYTPSLDKDGTKLTKDLIKFRSKGIVANEMFEKDISQPISKEEENLTLAGRAELRAFKNYCFPIGAYDVDPITEFIAIYYGRESEDDNRQLGIYDATKLRLEDTALDTSTKSFADATKRFLKFLEEKRQTVKNNEQRTTEIPDTKPTVNILSTSNIQETTVPENEQPVTTMEQELANVEDSINSQQSETSSTTVNEQMEDLSELRKADLERFTSEGILNDDIRTTVANYLKTIEVPAAVVIEDVLEMIGAKKDRKYSPEEQTQLFIKYLIKENDTEVLSTKKTTVEETPAIEEELTPEEQADFINLKGYLADKPIFTSSYFYPLNKKPQEATYAELKQMLKDLDIDPKIEYSDVEQMRMYEAYSTKQREIERKAENERRQKEASSVVTSQTEEEEELTPEDQEELDLFVQNIDPFLGLSIVNYIHAKNQRDHKFADFQTNNLEAEKILDDTEKFRSTSFPSEEEQIAMMRGYLLERRKELNEVSSVVTSQAEEKGEEEVELTPQEQKELDEFARSASKNGIQTGLWNYLFFKYGDQDLFGKMLQDLEVDANKIYSPKEQIKLFKGYLIKQREINKTSENQNTENPSIQETVTEETPAIVTPTEETIPNNVEQPEILPVEESTSPQQSEQTTETIEEELTPEEQIDLNLFEQEAYNNEILLSIGNYMTVKAARDHRLAEDTNEAFDKMLMEMGVENDKEYTKEEQIQLFKKYLIKQRENKNIETSAVQTEAKTVLTPVEHIPSETVIEETPAIVLHKEEVIPSVETPLSFEQPIENIETTQQEALPVEESTSTQQSEQKTETIEDELSPEIQKELKLFERKIVDGDLMPGVGLYLISKGISQGEFTEKLNNMLTALGYKEEEKLSPEQQLERFKKYLLEQEDTKKTEDIPTETTSPNSIENLPTEDSSLIPRTTLEQEDENTQPQTFNPTFTPIVEKASTKEVAPTVQEDTANNRKQRGLQSIEDLDLLLTNEENREDLVNIYGQEAIDAELTRRDEERISPVEQERGNNGEQRRLESIEDLDLLLRDEENRKVLIDTYGQDAIDAELMRKSLGLPIDSDTQNTEDSTKTTSEKTGNINNIINTDPNNNMAYDIDSPSEETQQEPLEVKDTGEVYETPEVPDTSPSPILEEELLKQEEVKETPVIKDNSTKLEEEFLDPEVEGSRRRLGSLYEPGENELLTLEDHKALNDFNNMIIPEDIERTISLFLPNPNEDSIKAFKDLLGAKPGETYDREEQFEMFRKALLKIRQKNLEQKPEVTPNTETTPVIQQDPIPEINVEPQTSDPFQGFKKKTPEVVSQIAPTLNTEPEIIIDQSPVQPDETPEEINDPMGDLRRDFAGATPTNTQNNEFNPVVPEMNPTFPDQQEENPSFIPEEQPIIPNTIPAETNVSGEIKEGFEKIVQSLGTLTEAVKELKADPTVNPDTVQQADDIQKASQAVVNNTYNFISSNSAPVVVGTSGDISVETKNTLERRQPQTRGADTQPITPITQPIPTVQPAPTIVNPQQNGTVIPGQPINITNTNTNTNTATGNGDNTDPGTPTVVENPAVVEVTALRAEIAQIRTMLETLRAQGTPAQTDPIVRPANVVVENTTNVIDNTQAEAARTVVPLTPQEERELRDAGTNSESFMTTIKRTFSNMGWKGLVSRIGTSLGSTLAISGASTAAITLLGPIGVVGVGAAFAGLGIYTGIKTLRNLRESARSQGVEVSTLMKEKGFWLGALTGGAISGAGKVGLSLVPGLGAVLPFVAMAAEIGVSVYNERKLNKDQSELYNKMMDSFERRRYTALRDRGYVIREGVDISKILQDSTNTNISVEERKTAQKTAIATLKYMYEKTQDNKYKFIHYTVKEQNVDVRKEIDITQIGVEKADGSSAGYPTLKLTGVNIESFIDTLDSNELVRLTNEAWTASNAEQKKGLSSEIITKFVGLEAADVDTLLSAERKAYFHTVAVSAGFNLSTGLINSVISVYRGSTMLAQGGQELLNPQNTANSSDQEQVRKDLKDDDAQVKEYTDDKGNKVEAINLDPENGDSIDIIHTGNDEYVIQTEVGAEKYFEITNGMTDVKYEPFTSSNTEVKGTFVDANGHAVGIMYKDSSNGFGVANLEQLSSMNGHSGATISDLQPDGNATLHIGNDTFKIDFSDLKNIPGSEGVDSSHMVVQPTDSMPVLLHNIMADAKELNPNLKGDILQLERDLYKGDGLQVNDAQIRSELGLSNPMQDGEEFNWTDSKTLISWLTEHNGGDPINLPSETSGSLGHNLGFTHDPLTHIDISALTPTTITDGIPTTSEMGIDLTNIGGLVGMAIGAFAPIQVGGLSRNNNEQQPATGANGTTPNTPNGTTTPPTTTTPTTTPPVARTTTVTTETEAQERERRESIKTFILENIVKQNTNNKYYIANNAETHIGNLIVKINNNQWNINGENKTPEDVVDLLLGLEPDKQVILLSSFLSATRSNRNGTQGDLTFNGITYVKNTIQPTVANGRPTYGWKDTTRPNEFIENSKLAEIILGVQRDANGTIIERTPAPIANAPAAPAPTTTEPAANTPAPQAGVATTTNNAEAQSQNTENRPETEKREKSRTLLRTALVVTGVLGGVGGTLYGIAPVVGVAAIVTGLGAKVGKWFSERRVSSLEKESAKITEQVLAGNRAFTEEEKLKTAELKKKKERAAESAKVCKDILYLTTPLFIVSALGAALNPQITEAGIKFNINAWLKGFFNKFNTTITRAPL